MKKKELELVLSQLHSFEQPKVRLEQYPTDAPLVADLLWNAFQRGHIKGKTVADLGCGSGILGFGALLLGARKVYFVDVDKDALFVAKKNKILLEKILRKKLSSEFVHSDVGAFDKRVQVVIENPPFGVKETHRDKLFLLKAMELAPVVYSFHKLSTKEFVTAFAKENGYKVAYFHTYRFPIKQAFWFHTSRIKHIDVGCWCLTKE